MSTKFLSLLAILVFSLSACGQVPTPTAPGSIASAARQNPTTPPIDNSRSTASFIPNPISPPVGGGAYWVASGFREADGRFSVFIVKPLSEAEPETIFRAESGDIPYNLHWSPDGQYLFFTVNHGEERLTQSFYLYDQVNRQLQSFDFQQMTGKQGNAWKADWSPDAQSRQLAFSLCATGLKDCSLWLADLTHGTAVQLKDQNEEWIWDTEGKALLFEESMDAPVRFDLQTMTEEKLAMPSRTQLNPEGGNWRLFGFFPNVGGYLVSRPNADETREIYLISPTGSQETLLFQTPQGWNNELIQPPLLSPDGRQIGLNFYSEAEEPTLIIGSLEQLPLQVPSAPEPQRGLVLQWSPDNSIYVTLVALQGVTEPCSLRFYDAQTGDLLQEYEPPAPFELSQWPGSSTFGGIQRHFYFGFDSVWIP
jgi:WD40 repeat protein